MKQDDHKPFIAIPRKFSKNYQLTKANIYIFTAGYPVMRLKVISRIININLEIQYGVILN